MEKEFNDKYFRHKKYYNNLYWKYLFYIFSKIIKNTSFFFLFPLFVKSSLFNAILNPLMALSILFLPFISFSYIKISILSRSLSIFSPFLDEISKNILISSYLFLNVSASSVVTFLSSSKSILFPIKNIILS